MAPKKVTTIASTSLDDAMKVALVKKKGKAALANDAL
jgi:predicted nucleic acid-binding protein